MAGGDGRTEERPAATDAPATVAPATETHAIDVAAEWSRVTRARLVVVEGPAQGLACDLVGARGSIGSHALNDLVIDDPTVSRFHCEVHLEAGGPYIVDLRSKNGTIVDGVTVREALLRHGSAVQLGRATLRFELVSDSAEVRVPQISRFGGLVAAGKAMRATLALLARAATGDSTVLLDGETGTGKGQAAEAIHQASRRADQPFMVVDCGGIPENLLDSELFGHEKGAFTGADARRIGAFEEASGGTLFLDEIGELPTALQPKLLRALENREIRRVGSNKFIPIDIRVITATHRDLRADVNAGRFRADLYYRLAVVKIRMPALRERPEEIPALVEELLDRLGASAEARRRIMTADVMEGLRRAGWPGNIRELRNHIERSIVFDAPEADAPRGAAAARPRQVMPFVEARRIARDAFERGYLETLMDQFQGKVAQAAEAARIDRVYLYRLLRRQGIKPVP